VVGTCRDPIEIAIEVTRIIVITIAIVLFFICNFSSPQFFYGYKNKSKI
jgi:hypothetical protein